MLDILRSDAAGISVPLEKTVLLVLACIWKAVIFSLAI